VNLVQIRSAVPRDILYIDKKVTDSAKKITFRSSPREVNIC